VGFFTWAKAGEFNVDVPAGAVDHVLSEVSNFDG